MGALKRTGPNYVEEETGPGGARMPDWPIRPCRGGLGKKSARAITDLTGPVSESTARSAVAEAEQSS